MRCLVPLLLLVQAGCCTNTVLKQGQYRKSLAPTGSGPLLVAGDGSAALGVSACRERKGFTARRERTACVDRYLVGEAGIVRRTLWAGKSRGQLHKLVLGLSRERDSGWYLAPSSFEGNAATMEDLPERFNDGETTVQEDPPYSYAVGGEVFEFSPYVRLDNIDKTGREPWSVPLLIVGLPVAVALDVLTSPVQLVVVVAGLLQGD